MSDFENGTSLEEALLAEEQEIEKQADVAPSARDISAFSGFGSDGVTPAKINGEDYANLD